MTAPDDRALDRLRRGDEAAFRDLYKLHTPRLFAIALRLLSRRADADDAVQETWFRAVRGIRSFRGESSFPTWLTGIVIRCSLEALRKRGPADPGASESSVNPAPDLTLDLERAVASLPDGYRTVLILHDVEGLTHDEIAGMLEIEPGTSKSQLFHARRALRERLRPAPTGVER